MREPFEVWRYHFPGKGEHPAVLIGHPDIVARAAVVNGLFCTSQRQSRSPKRIEVLLNGADGLDWATFCDCSCLYAVPSAGLFGKRGRVTLERRQEIRRKVRDLFQLDATDQPRPACLRLTHGGFASAGARATRSKLKSWTTIDAYEQTQRPTRPRPSGRRAA